MQNSEEKFSSDNGMLASFIGFRPHLSEGFFMKIKPKFNVSSIYLFVPDTNWDAKIENGSSYQDFVIRLENKIRERFMGTETKYLYIKDMWNINDIYPKLTEIKENFGIINISAGPSPFIASVILWILTKKNIKIAHVIEVRSPKTNEVESYTFEIINTVPYLNSIFMLDDLDKFIISEINSRKNNTHEIYKDILKNFAYSKKVSLRTIENRINKLILLDILYRTDNKKYTLYINDEILKIVKDLKFLK